jgi:hypothetical protein
MVQFTSKIARRITATAKHVERTLTPLPKMHRRIPPTAQATTYYAKNTAAINPGTFEAPSTFTADIWLVNTSGNKPYPYARTTDTTQQGITVKNPWNVNVSTLGTRIKIDVENGEYVLQIVDNC